MMNMFRKKTKNKKSASIKAGFSLLEVLVALFVFSILVIAIAGVYIGFLGANSNAKATQRNLEGAQAAFNGLSKTLRTSRIIVPAVQPAVAVTKIRVYDYSQSPSGSACVEYSISGDKLWVSAATEATLDESYCTGTKVLGTPVSLIDGRVFGGFLVTLPTVANAGKVTVSLQLCPKGSSSSICNAVVGSGSIVGSPIRIQSSVSLRITE